MVTLVVKRIGFMIFTMIVVSLILFLVIVWTVISQFPAYRQFKSKLMDKVFRRKSCEADFDIDNPEKG